MNNHHRSPIDSSHGSTYLIILAMVLTVGAMSVAGQMEAQESAVHQSAIVDEQIQRQVAQDDHSNMAALALMPVDRKMLRDNAKERIEADADRTIAELENIVREGASK